MSTSASLGSFICEMRELGQMRSFFGALKFSDLGSLFPGTQSSRRRQLLCVRVLRRLELCRVPFPDAGLQQPRGCGQTALWGSRGRGVLPILSQGEAGDSLACPRSGAVVPTAAQSRRLSSPLPELLTISISQEVGDQAEGPWGQVPGQLLQLTQQAFDFCLQVLHRLLHRLE